MSKKPEALVFADDRPMSTSDDLYQWAVDAEYLIRAQHALIAELESKLAAVQRSTHHEHEWVRVATADRQHAVHLSLSQLAYDEDEQPYVVAHADDEQGTQLRFYLNTQPAAQEMDARDAARYRFARDSDSEFAICYWDELAGYNGEWVCRGSNGDAIDLLDAAIAAQPEQGGAA